MKIFAYAMREFDEKEFFDQFSKEFNCEYDYSTSYPSSENVELARGFDAISATPCDLNADMLERFYNVGVRYIATRSIGVDHIDLQKAKEFGMGVCHVSYAPETVADYAIMLMLMCCRKIYHILERSKVQDYTLKGKMGKDICDCTVGIIGTGQIGKTVIKHLSTFGCRLLAYDLYPNAECAEIAEYVSLEELYAQCDIITLHAPATADNYHMLNKEAFDRMKEDVIIINTARGALIDEEALIEALQEGMIAGAGLDVQEVEPPREDNPLYYMDNVILTPHMGWRGLETRQRLVSIAADDIRNFLAGTPINVIV